MTMTDIPPAHALERWTPAPFQSLGATFRAYYPKLLAFVERTRSRDEADDVVQETMVRYMKRLRTWEPASPVEEETALMTIARDIAIGRRRRRLRHDLADHLITGGTAVAGPALGAEAVLQVEQVRNTILAIANELPPRMRQTFFLRYDCDATWDTIGAMLGLEAGAARGMYSRALKHLRRELAARDIDHTVLAQYSA